MSFNKSDYFGLSIAVSIVVSSMAISYGLIGIQRLKNEKELNEKLFNIAICTLEKKPVPEDGLLREWAILTVDLNSYARLPKKYLDKNELPAFGQCNKSDTEQ